MARILIVDDDTSVLEILTTVLGAHDHDLTAIFDGEQAREYITGDEETFDLMMSDIDMTPYNGIQLLEMVSQHKPQMPVVMMTGNARLETATKAMKFGAYDYIMKPFKMEELIPTIERAIQYGYELGEKDPNAVVEDSRSAIKDFIAASPATQQVAAAIQKMAPLDAPVLISGEPGTGKTHVANAIRDLSRRNTAPFERVNCATIPEPILEMILFGHSGKTPFAKDSKPAEGLFEFLEGGCILLDEIGWLPPALQERLLTAIKGGTVKPVGATASRNIDVRILAMSNIPLKKQVEDGVISKTLFQALSGLAIKLVPLRERPEDILPLAYQTVIAETQEGDKPAVMDHDLHALLLSYDWPGNIWELIATMRHTSRLAQDGRIPRDVFPDKIKATVITEASRKLLRKSDAAKGKSLHQFIRSTGMSSLQKGLKGGSEDAAADEPKSDGLDAFRKRGLRISGGN